MTYHNLLIIGICMLFRNFQDGSRAGNLGMIGLSIALSITLVSCGSSKTIGSTNCKCPPFATDQQIDIGKVIDSIRARQDSIMTKYGEELLHIIQGTPEYQRLRMLRAQMAAMDPETAQEDAFNEIYVEIGDLLIEMENKYSVAGSSGSPSIYNAMQREEFSNEVDLNGPCNLDVLESLHNEMLDAADQMNNKNHEKLELFRSEKAFEPLLCRVRCDAIDSLAINEYEESFRKYNIYQGFSYKAILRVFDLWEMLDTSTHRNMHEDKLYSLLTEDIVKFLKTLSQTIDDVDAYGSDASLQILEFYRDLRTAIDYKKISWSIQNMRIVFVGGYENLYYGGHILLGTGQWIGNNDLVEYFIFPKNISDGVEGLHKDRLTQSKPKINWGNVLHGNYIERLETPGCPVLFSLNLTGSATKSLQPINNQSFSYDIGEFHEGQEKELNGLIRSYLDTFRSDYPSVAGVTLILEGKVSGKTVGSLKKQINF